MGHRSSYGTIHSYGRAHRTPTSSLGAASQYAVGIDSCPWDRPRSTAAAAAALLHVPTPGETSPMPSSKVQSEAVATAPGMEGGCDKIVVHNQHPFNMFVYIYLHEFDTYDGVPIRRR